MTSLTSFGVLTSRRRPRIIPAVMGYFFRTCAWGLLAAGLQPAAFAADTAPGSFASKEFGLYFDAPAGWTLDKKPADGLCILKDTLGLLEINVAAHIIPQKKDVRDFADKEERNRGLGAGKVLTLPIDGGAFDAKQVEVLTPFVLDDTKKTEEARRKFEENKNKTPLAVGVCPPGDAGSIPPEEPTFLAEITTRYYANEAWPKSHLAYYVIGGGVGYTVTVSAARADFFGVLPLALDAVKAMRLDKLSGGRYALPDAKAISDARMGIIMGKVLSNGTPIPGAAVNLYASAGDHQKGVPTFRVLANSYGEYTITQLRPGRYYMIEVYGVSDAGARVRSVQPITNIEITDGRVTFVNLEVAPQ